MTVTQMRDKYGSEGVEKLLILGYILKVELIGFV